MIADLYYGLDDIELNQQVFCLPPIITFPCEIVLPEGYVIPENVFAAKRNIPNSRREYQKPLEAMRFRWFLFEKQYIHFPQSGER